MSDNPAKPFQANVTPRRIQRQRTRGWRMPEGAVYVGRPGRFGNPFPVTESATAQMVVDRYRHAVANGWDDFPSAEVIVAELAGKNLCCWCPLDSPCHADVLLEIANGADA